jgi:hypothetical protein
VDVSLLFVPLSAVLFVGVSSSLEHAVNDAKQRAHTANAKAWIRMDVPPIRSPA